MLVTYPAAAGGEAQPLWRERTRAALATLTSQEGGKPQYASSAQRLLRLLVGDPWSDVPRDAPPLPGKWPVVIFSHGLKGSLDMYSHLCAEMASFGAVVLALEHEDASGLCARPAAGEEIS